ncbi:MAG: hypothetical protein MZV70_21710 [Desulfobacterales bacterium]|nr:hypothetical protein [Desulfobacterales bacterium]
MKANDFLDIVELFLYATISFIVVFPDETTLILDEDSALREEYADEELSFEHIEVRLEKTLVFYQFTIHQYMLAKTISCYYQCKRVRRNILYG